MRSSGAVAKNAAVTQPEEQVGITSIR